jgi:transposase
MQGEVVPASEKEPEGWSAADKFTVVMERHLALACDF